jgi:DNA-binding beta-propeller fold protein YncE
VIAVGARTGRVFVLDVATHVVGTWDTRSGSLIAGAPAFPSLAMNDPNTPILETSVGMAVTVDERRRRAMVAIGSPYPGVPGAVTVLDALTDRLLRVLPVGNGVAALAVDTASGHLFVLDRLANTLSLIDPGTGVLLRRLTLGQGPAAMILAARTRRLFVATTGALGPTGLPTGRGRISMIDAVSGALLRTVATGVAPIALAVDEQTGRLFVASAGAADLQGDYLGGGGITILDSRTAAVLRTVPAAQRPRVLAVDARSAQLFVATCGSPTSTGSLLVLDAHSGALRRTLPLGPCPTALAVDQQRGRLFVADAGGVVVPPPAASWLPESLRHWVPGLAGPRPAPRTSPPSVSILDAAL